MAVVLEALGRGLTVVTFGDSILDCAHFNEHGLDPGRLIVQNDDLLFPEFQGRDLSSRGPSRLDHRAVDGSTVDDLYVQAMEPALKIEGPAIALVTVGGNDLLAGLLDDDVGPGVASFAKALDAFLGALPIRPVLVGNVYDPTFGDDEMNALRVTNPARARTNFARVNAAIGRAAGQHGVLVDIHGHFLHGEPGWFTRVIEPSLLGASEIRRCFLRALGL